MFSYSVVYFMCHMDLFCFVLAKFGFARIKFGTFIKLVIATFRLCFYSINLIID